MDLDQKAIQHLNEIGIALSQEHRKPFLLEMILLSAKELTNADGGTIYMVTPEKTIHFEIMVSTSLGLHMGGVSRAPVPFKDLPLFLEDGSSNDNLIVAYAVNHKMTVNIQDAYHEQGFDFSGTRSFDEKTGYRTRSVLTIPIKNHENEVVGGLQLINPPSEQGFSESDVHLAESLASQAAVALTNQVLIQNFRKLFESLIRVIAEAIDEKSPSTGNHSKRVPEIAVLLAEAISASDEEPFKEAHFSQKDIYELKIAAYLHDCGKITTPVHILEKKTKLEAIYDRIESIRARYRALREKTEKETLLKKIEWFELHCPKEFEKAHDTFFHLDTSCLDKIQQLEQEQFWIEKINEGKEPVTEETVKKLKEIALSPEGLLTPDETEHLSVTKGNLTEKDREILRHHVVMTYRMLSQLDFPKELRKVPEIAASHHERADGKGYPRGLKNEDMLLQSRILVIADIFEALSAPDRPYRLPLPLSEVFRTMQGMVDEGHLDSDLYSVFVKKKAYLPYAKQYLSPEQLDI